VASEGFAAPILGVLAVGLALDGLRAIAKGTHEEIIMPKKVLASLFRSG
jgi:hypothetical protein